MPPKCDVSVFLEIKLNLLQAPSPGLVRNSILVTRRGSLGSLGSCKNPKGVDTAQNIQKRDFWFWDNSCHYRYTLCPPKYITHTHTHFLQKNCICRAPQMSPLRFSRCLGHCCRASDQSDQQKAKANPLYQLQGCSPTSLPLIRGLLPPPPESISTHPMQNPSNDCRFSKT